ncbi:MAG: FAD-dependent oxidoreductase [Burkholderiales bacterium]|nr:FAD-dependent oxidoreductase [Burkholderiales bacterium]
MKTGSCELAVVGGGITALTAAWHAALDGCQVMLLAGDDLPGGLVANIGAVDGFPGSAPVAGMAMAERLMQGIVAHGGIIERSVAEGIDAASGGLVLRTATARWRAGKVIAATGARLAALDVPGAAALRDKGVLQCAWCNAGLYRGRRVVVIGAGDAAFQETLHLAGCGAKVTMVIRGEAVRARRSLVEQAAANEAITFLWSTEVTEVIGTDHVTGVALREHGSGETSSLDCDAVFPYIGLVPAGAWLGDLVETGPAGAVITDARLRTRTSGLFAAGAVRQGYGGRLTDAVGEATLAAREACAALAGNP